MAEAQKKSGPVIALLHMHAAERVQDEVNDVYRQLTPSILEGSPALAVSTLAKNRDPLQQDMYLIVSQWDDVDAYQAWESSEEHRTELRPLVRLVQGLRPETFHCVVD